MIVRGNLKVGPVAAVGTPAPVCPVTTFDYRPNKQVHLTVYNSTRREGLAGTVAAELKKRGYYVVKVANKSAEYAGTAVVVSGPAGRAAAFNLQRNIAGTDYVADTRSDATVDVYLTGAFKELVPTIKVDQTPGRLSCPRLNPEPTLPAASPGAQPTTTAP
ncbi:LytR C-terminal domain-containing protein [Paenarthrobacter sp. Z7-10]|nr:LytR C-terminal domain-containing protein [Paenarthrobacter sp. Z7-10]